MQEPKFTEVENVLELFGRRIVSAMDQTLLSQGHYTTEALQQSIQFTISRMAMPITFQLTLLDYYKYVDEGRKPGGKFPPPEVIRQWIINKNLAVRGRETAKVGKLVIGKARKDRKDVKIATLPNLLKQMTFLIGRKIAREGIPASNFFSDQVNDASIGQLQVELSKAFKQDVMVQIVKIKDQLRV